MDEQLEALAKQAKTRPDHVLLNWPNKVTPLVIEGYLVEIDYGAASTGVETSVLGELPGSSLGSTFNALECSTQVKNLSQILIF